jgi:hypothetical protein
MDTTSQGSLPNPNHRAPEAGADQQVPACLPDNIKDKTEFKRSMEEIWKFMVSTLSKPDTFFHDLMQLITKAKVVLDKDWKALESNMKLLLQTFEHASESGMMSIG